MRVRGEVHIRAPLKQINIHLIVIFPCAISYVRAIMNGFMFHICAGAHIYYNCNFPFKNVLTLIYRITKTLSAEINFPCPAIVGEPAVFSHLARVQYLHTAQLVGCWEQIGIRITQSVILFRVRHASD